MNNFWQEFKAWLIYTVVCLTVALGYNVPAFAGDVYFHTRHALGSVIGGKNETDGNLPYWGTVGFTYVPDDGKFETFVEAFHRSNADRDQDGEYELNGLRVGVEYKVKL